jgi:hypothetical protein
MKFTRHIKAFLLGVWEFRTNWTTHFEDYDLLLSYDKGREFAHKLTLRRFEP